nr:hypothetical protein YPPY64_0053 [Yersinia pestis PY-64]
MVHYRRLNAYDLRLLPLRRIPSKVWIWRPLSRLSASIR